MLKSNTLHITQVEVQKPYQVICSHIENGRNKTIIITFLDEDDEKRLDHNHSITLHRGNKVFTVSKNTVYAYGEIDYTENSDDYNTLADMNWFNHLTLRGINVPSSYNYKDNIIESDLKGGRWFDTTRAELVCQFKHGQLGKPKRSIIFKVYT